MKDKALLPLFAIVVVLAAVMSVTLVPKLFKAEVVPVSSKYGSIVRLVNEGRTFCSGTVIQPNLIVTAAHCVLMDTPFGPMLREFEIEIRPNSNAITGAIAHPVYVSVQMDQALLMGNFSMFDTRPYITNPSELTALRVAGKGFVSCGYPLAGNMFCTTTVFKHQDNFFWAVDGVLIPGMSGGPTMIGGVVIAVNTAVEKELSIVSPIYNITADLQKKVEALKEHK